MTRTQELQKEHKEITRLVELMQSFDPNYTGPHGFDTDYDNWLAQLSAQTIDMMEDQAEWQAAQVMGFSFS